MRLVLASASPRRAALVRAAGFSVEAVGAALDERVRPDEPASAYVRRLAGEKSAAVLKRLLGSPPATQAVLTPEKLVVIGADTSVVIDGEILGKPANAREAGAMLRRLAGRQHEVLTGLSVRTVAHEVGHVETTTVRFAEVSDEDVAWYAASREGQDKAGGYGIQGLASRFVLDINGSYSNVVGLPVAALCALLRTA